MHATRNQKSLEYDKKVRKARRRRNLLGILACIVALCTMYSLMLPAITMESDTVCGLDEHVHTPDCYALPERVLHCTASAHVHNAECYDEGGNLICGVSDYLIHAHDAACYDEAGNLWCTLPEHPQHTHGESCYDESGALICLYTSAESHQHSQACFVQSSPALICGIQEHQHTEGCYPQVLTQTAEICEQSMSDLMETEEDQAGAMTDQTETGSDQVETVSDQTETGQDQTETAPDQTETGPDQTEIAPDWTEFAQEQLAPQTFGLLPEVSLLGETAPGDFKGAINGVTYSGLVYNPNTDEHTANLSLKFKIEKTAVLGSNYAFTYALPNGIIIPDSILGQSFDGYDAGNNKGFTFQFEKNEDGTYRVDIFFIASYVEDGGDTFSGKMTFDVVFGESAYAEDGGIEIDFNENVKLDIPPEEMGYSENETKDYDLTLTKNGSYNPGTGKIVYTVTVVSKKGTPGPINLTDVLTANGLEIQGVQVTSVQLQDFTNSWGGLGEATAVTEYTGNFDQTTSTLTMALPQLTAGSGDGQKYTITYEVDVADPGSAVYSPKNTVTGTSEKEGGSEITHTVDKTVTVKKMPPTKTGSYDAANGEIDWKITLNQDGGDITGYTLTDPMFADLTESDIVLSPNSGYELVKNSDGTIQGIRFSATENGKNHQEYTITYSTPQKTSWTETSVTNEATITPPGGTPTEVSATVTYKNNPPTKTGSYDAANGEVDWTITINAEQANIAGATLKDTMFAGLTASDIVLTPSSGYELVTSSDGKIESIKFLATESGENHQKYTITYSTPQETSWTETTVKNDATYIPPDGPSTTVSSTVTCKSTPPAKSGTYDPEKGVITWTITVNQDQANIVGYELTDTMLAGLSAEEIHIQPADIGYRVETDEQGKITKIVFTEAADGTGENKNTYTITYTTQQDSVWGTVNVKNTVSYGTGDKKTEVTATVPVTGGSVEKTHTTAPVGSDGSMEITWTTSFTIPGAGLPAGSTITDTLVNPGSIHYMTATQIQALKTELDSKLGSVSYTLQISSDGTNWANYEENITGNFVAYKVTFPNGVDGTRFGNQAISLSYASTAKPGSGFDPAVYANRVTIAAPNGSHSDEDKEEVPGGSLDKRLEAAGEPANGKKTLTWKTSLTVPGAGLPAGSTITDTLINPGTDHYMTAGQIVALKTELDRVLGSVSYTLQVSSGGENWVDYNGNPAGNFVAYKVTLTEGLAAATFGGRKLEFTYSSTADISSVLTAKDYVNKVVVLTPNGDSLEDQDKHTHTGTSGVEKTAESTHLQGNLKEITWKTAITLESGVLAKDMVITDTIQNPGTTHYMTSQQVSDLQKTLDNLLGSGKYELTLSSDGQNFAEAAENVIAYKITMLEEVQLTENTIAYTYQTTADVSAVTTSKTFTNKVEVENPQGDKVSDEASYTHTCRVFKYDGSFKPGESSVTTEDGVLTWKVKVELDKTYTEVKIKDTLPDGVSLTKLEYSTEQYWLNNGGVYTVDSASWSSNNKNAAVTVEGQTVTTTFQNVSGTLWLTYTCQLGEEQLNQSTTTNIGKLKNQVEVTTEEGELGSSEQTQEVTVEKPSEDLKYVDKSASYSKNNATIHYSVLINKDAVDYLPEKDTIHFTDILSYQFEYINYPMEVTLIPSSVKLYKAVAGEDGSYTKGDAVDFAWTLKETPITSQSCTVTSTLEGDVPDGTALILEYDYFVKVRNGYTASNQNPIGFNVSNTAKLEGETERKDTLDNHISWEKPAAGGSISTEKTYTIYKVEEGDYSKPLDGAVFTLYKYDADQEDFVPAEKTYTTANGMIQISWQNDLDTFWFDENTAYYIVETQAPEGYMLPAEPTKYYFYFSDDDTTANPEAYPSDWDTSSEYENKADLVANNRTIYCENTSSTTDLTVRKAWVNSSGESIAAPANSISFDLYQVVSHTPPSDSTEPEMVKLTVKGGGHNANPNYGYNNTPVQKGSILTLVIAYKDSISNPNPTVTANSTSLTPTIDGKTYTYTLKVSADTEVVARYNSNDGDATITVTVESPPVAETTEKCYGSYTLTAEQGWKTVLTNLPRTGVDESGATVYYSYYVKETTEGYTVTYSNGNNPVAGGAITITNTTDQTATALTVQKLWKKADGTEMDSPTYTAEIQLYQRTGSGETSHVGSLVQLNSENNWTYQWANLPAADDTGGSLTYYVEETAVTDGSGADITGKFNVTYSTNEATNNGEITVTNTVSITVQLPETGGCGDGIYQVLGWLLLSLATAALMAKKTGSWRKGEGGAA